MLQYKIPQNVGIEDKIVGPFSLRQLIILAVGGGTSYILFVIVGKLYEMNIIEYILIAFPALFALAAATLKLHNVTFTKYIFLMLEFAIKPKKRMWDHRGISALVAPDLTEKMTIGKDQKVSEKSKKDVNLTELSAMLDSGGFEHIKKVTHDDIDRVADDDLITEAYFGHKKKDSSTQNMYWRTREVQKKKLDFLAKIPIQKIDEKKDEITENKESSIKQPPSESTEQEQAMQVKSAEKAASKEPAQPLVSDVNLPHPLPPDKEIQQKTEEKIQIQASSAPTIQKTFKESGPPASPTPNTSESSERKIPVKRIEEGSKEEKNNKEQSNVIIRDVRVKKMPEIKVSEMKLTQKPQQENKQQSKKETPISNQQTPNPQKKRRKRKKRKQTGGPTPNRQNTQIDSTAKNQPVKLIDKQESKTPPPPKIQPQHEQETSFSDLKGGEIEFNLD